MQRIIVIGLVVGGLTVGLSQAGQGVFTQEVIGVDARGVPLVSGPVRIGTASTAESVPQGDVLPPGVRGWETIPSVIRTDGREAFRLEVETNGPVARVTLDPISTFFVASGPTPNELRDDGLEGDRVAGDFVFTSVELRYNTAIPYPFANLRADPSSPAGIDSQYVGSVSIHELSGTVTQFLTGPAVGLVLSNVPSTSRFSLASDVAVSPHVINVSTDDRLTQRTLRTLGFGVAPLAQRVYSVLPDDFDFLILVSPYKVEVTPAQSSPNYYAGLHSLVQVNYTGTGLTPFDNSGTYGSRGRLLGISILDAFERGLISNNVTHEISHQWASFTGLLNDGTAHYNVRTSVGSLLGGIQWIDNGNGTYTVNCGESRGAAHRAAPLDLYMMGLVDAIDVPPIHRARSTVDILGSKCAGEPLTAAEIERTVTVADLQRLHGPRQPGPPNAKKDYRVAFVAESRGRLLNTTEMTFYETLAAYYTKPIPAQEPDPYLTSGNWVPVTRFFGHGTTWRSDVWQVPTTVTLVPSVASPQAIGTTIALAATASGGGTPYQYRFWVMPWATGVWQIVQDWSADDSYTWREKQTGGYNLAVQVRTAGSTESSAQTAVGYELVEPPSRPLKAVNLTADVPSAQPLGRTILFTADADGGAPPVQFRFWIMPWATGAWAVVQDWSPTSIYAWTPTMPGGYNVAVQARQRGAVEAEVQSAVGYEIGPR